MFFAQYTMSALVLVDQERLRKACQGLSYAKGGYNVTHLKKLYGSGGSKLKRAQLLEKLCKPSKSASKPAKPASKPAKPASKPTKLQKRRSELDQVKKLMKIGEAAYHDNEADALPKVTAAWTAGEEYGKKSTKPMADHLADLEATESCEGTLCIDTAQAMVKSLTHLETFSDVNKWSRSFPSTDNSITLNHFIVSIDGKAHAPDHLSDQMKKYLEGKSTNVLRHAFVIVHGHNGTWHLCDSWEAIHPIKCRQRSLKDLVTAIKMMENKAKTGTYDDSEHLLNFFDNDDQSRWVEAIAKLDAEGEYTQEYEDIFNDNPLHYDLEFSLEIRKMR